MSWSATLKRIEAQQKREERAAKKRQKELEKLLKEEAKLSAQEQARLEVEAFENSLDVLLSVHRDVSPTIDWMATFSALPPFRRSNLEASQFDDQLMSWQKMRELARKVLAGEEDGYKEALTDMSSFGELATLGESIAFRVDNRKVISAEIRVSGRDTIPREVKTLSAANKLLVKPMPKTRFHDLYQDYVCGCALRVGREVFALLPVELVIVTAFVPFTQVSTGKEMEMAVLSVAMSREKMSELDFEKLDPSDSMENFPHRGDVLVSKKTGEFTPIKPLASEEISSGLSSSLPCDELWIQVKQMRTRIELAVKKTVKGDQ